MRKLIVLLALSLAAPAAAQTSLKPPASTDGTQPRQRFVTVFGADPCPKSTDKDEIIVCSRRPDEERYRIPTTVRSGNGRTVSPYATRRERLAALAAGGAGGSIGSCTPVGPGGGTGCNKQLQDAYREEKHPR